MNLLSIEHWTKLLKNNGKRSGNESDKYRKNNKDIRGEKNI